MSETYRASDPSFVDALERLGLVSESIADENLRRWDEEWRHIDDLTRRSKEAWQALPGPARMLKLEHSWRRRWEAENDSWHSAKMAKTLAELRREANAGVLRRGE